MKTTTTLIFSILFSITVWGQTASETIKKANDLVAVKKYESAYTLLDNFDPNNRNIDIVLLKEDIALKYFVSSIMHQAFAFIDIKENEDIRDYRDNEGKYEMKIFEINKVLDSLLLKYPENCKLHKGLGDFYYQIHLKYNGKWLMPDNELYDSIKTNDQKAIDDSCGDYLTYFTMGYLFIAKDNFKEGIPFFMKSLALKKDFASSYYNIAFSYLNLNEKDSVLKYARLSFDIDSDRVFKSDAARMLGQVYSDMFEGEKAIASYELADRTDSNNYYNIKPLLLLYVKRGSPKVYETTIRFFNLDPTNPTIYNDLAEIYNGNKRENDLIDFYKKQMADYQDNKNVLGNLNFFLGKTYFSFDKKLAKEYFLKAKDLFTQVYDKDHPVFKIIEDGIKEADKP